MPGSPRPTTARTAELLALVDAGVTESRRVEARRAEHVLAWVEAHALDAGDPTQAGLLDSPGVGTLSLGAAEIHAEPFCDTELAVVLRVHPLAARALMSDVVDLARRLPRTWSTLLGGDLELWVARKIASATRPLDARGAAEVDAALAPALATLPTGRLLDLAAARAVEAAPEAADVRAAERRTRQGVWLTRPTATGSTACRPWSPVAPSRPCARPGPRWTTSPTCSPRTAAPTSRPPLRTGHHPRSSSSAARPSGCWPTRWQRSS
ncbi:hypothetical protein GCM10027596_17430 [Nocardioides korecus]